MADPDGPSTDGKSRRGTFRIGAAQVDVCPEDAGFILSIGRVSVWLNTSDALDAAQALARALEHQVVAGQSSTDETPDEKADEEAASGERSIASLLLPVKS
jgi:hypothetical protein